MNIVYNQKLNGYQILHTPNIYIKHSAWNTPVTDRIFPTWDDASAYLDKISE